MSEGPPVFAVALPAGDDPRPWIEALQPRLPGFAVRSLEEAGPRAQVRYVAAWRQRAGSLAGLSGLAAVFSLGAGVDHLLADPLLPDVPVIRFVDPDLTGRMSEWVVLQVLLHHRQHARYRAQQRDAVWRDDAGQPAAREVRVGVMGLGELGADAARKLALLGFDVAGWSRRPRTLPDCATYGGPAQLSAFLARTQILVVLLPLTEATRGLLDRRLFAQLARDGHAGGPVLLNAGRGGLQNEADILACLEDGTLRAASLDVFGSEPLPPEAPLWHHPAVTITPHNAAVSNPKAVAACIAAQVAAHESGRPFRHVVDRASGY